MKKKDFERPSFQRPIDDDERTDAIKDYIVNNIRSPVFTLGMIVVSFKKGRVRIIDGQHRIKGIIKAIPLIEDSLHITIPMSLYTGINETHEKELYKMINKGVPVPKFYIDDEGLDEYYEEVKKLFNKKYSECLKPTRNCRIPNLNLDRIVEEMHERRVVKLLVEDGIVLSPREIKSKIVELNNFMKEVMESNDRHDNYDRHTTTSQQDKLETNIKKIKDSHKCYLGLIPSYKWVEWICRHGKF
jgi:hypothetical protein